MIRLRARNALLTSSVFARLLTPRILYKFSSTLISSTRSSASPRESPAKEGAADAADGRRACGGSVNRTERRLLAFDDGELGEAAVELESKKVDRPESARSRWGWSRSAAEPAPFEVEASDRKTYDEAAEDVLCPVI